MSLKRMVLSFTTASTGSATVDGERSVQGKLYALEYQPGDTNTGAVLTATCENGVTSAPLLTKTGAGTANSIFYPRSLAHYASNGSQLHTPTSGSVVEQPLLSGVPRIVIASSGSGATGKVILFYED